MSAATDPPRISQTILAVDDDQLVLHLLDEVLRSAGYHVLTAAGGRSAIQTYESLGSPIHLLLTDVIMPDLTGPAVAIPAAGGNKPHRYNPARPSPPRHGRRRPPPAGITDRRA